jgi:hypothetical protein
MFIDLYYSLINNVFNAILENYDYSDSLIIYDHICIIPISSPVEIFILEFYKAIGGYGKNNYVK